jgi:predicted lipoprotein with Yx(FWY)xxD motif
MPRNTRNAFLATALVVPLFVLAAVGCGGGGGGKKANGSTTLPTTAGGRPATLGVENNNNLGEILADTKGRTLYLFQADVGRKSVCTGACAAAWPPLRAGGKPVVGNGASAAKIATGPRPDGGPQVTYNGHPLYTYTADRKPGDSNGQGLNAFGGLWYVVDPAGDQVTGTGSGGPSGLGY